MPADIPGGDFGSCVDIMMEERGHDEESAESICGALEEEAKADHGDPSELLDALERGAGLIADVGVDLVSGVDVPAVDSKWTMLKSADDAHDYRVATPILLSKQDDDEDDEERRISYAAAMIPREVDKEGDVVATPTVEKAAHDFLTQDGGVDTDHSLIDGDGQVVESWVLKEDRTFDLPDGGTETYGAGTWMVGIKWAAEPWERIKAGELTGLSIYGMAEHVPLSRSCALGKQADIPVAGPPEDIHLTYRTEADAERASEVLGLDGATHPHTLDGDTVYMPGGTHQEFVDLLTGGEEDDRALSDGKSQDGDTHKGDAGKEGGMGQDDSNPDDSSDGGDDGPTIGEVAASVESLAETVESVTETMDTVKEAVETDKQDEMEAAATLAEEHGMSPDDVVDILQLAEGKDLEAVFDAIDSAGAEEMENANDEEEDEDDEMEQSAEKRAEDANFGKGSDARKTAAKGIDTDGEGTTGLSYAELAAEEAEN